MKLWSVFVSYQLFSSCFTDLAHPNLISYKVVWRYRISTLLKMAIFIEILDLYVTKIPNPTKNFSASGKFLKVFFLVIIFDYMIEIMTENPSFVTGRKLSVEYFYQGRKRSLHSTFFRDDGTWEYIHSALFWVSSTYVEKMQLLHTVILAIKSWWCCGSSFRCVSTIFP